MAVTMGKGPAGGATNRPLVDRGTLCRQASPFAGAVGTAQAGRPLGAVGGPVLVGKSKRDPGFNYDGTRAEDMTFGDSPGKSAGIRNDPVFKLNDATLGAYLKQLLQSLSVGKMEEVALAMHTKFLKAEGGTFRSDILNAEVAGNAAFTTYHASFLRQLHIALGKCGMDPRRISVIPMGLLAFTSFWDKVSGLGITVHQVWAVKAELGSFILDCASGAWMGSLVYTFYDHFGLDWEDILKHQNDRIPQYHTGNFFKAWYILQHYRGARPFITEMKVKQWVVVPGTGP